MLLIWEGTSLSQMLKMKLDLPQNMGNIVYINGLLIALGGLVVSVLAIWRKVRGLKPARGRCTLRVKQIRSTTSFGGEVKPSVPCRMILRHVKESYECERYLVAKFNSNFSQISPPSVLDVSAGNWQRALVDESGMIRTQIRMHNKSEMVAVQGSPSSPVP
jgi:hypothetical protein